MAKEAPSDFNFSFTFDAFARSPASGNTRTMRLENESAPICAIQQLGPHHLWRGRRILAAGMVLAAVVQTRSPRSRRVAAWAVDFWNKLCARDTAGKSPLQRSSPATVARTPSDRVSFKHAERRLRRRAFNRFRQTAPDISIQPVSGSQGSATRAAPRWSRLPRRTPGLQR